jgi:hypothetical protein
MSESLKKISESMPKLAQELRRLGKNVNGYLGETIDIAGVLSDVVAAGREHGWALEEIHSAPKLILALSRRGPGPTQAGTGGSMNVPKGEADLGQSGRIAQQGPRIYISSGIHGDEPAGPLAVRQLIRENRWPAGAELWLCPCLNPAGFVANRRENPDGVDLNREYLKPTAEEIIYHTAWLERQPAFDLSLCLHEDWESRGFYVYELNPDRRRSLAETIVERVAEVCPVDFSDVIEGRPAKNGIIRPDFDPRSRPQWPEAFYLITHKTRLSYTLEAPSDFPLSARVAALVAGVNAALGS